MLEHASCELLFMNFLFMYVFSFPQYWLHVEGNLQIKIDLLDITYMIISFYSQNYVTKQNSPRLLYYKFNPH